MYYVYVLESLRNGRYYIGHSSDVEARLAFHNAGKVKGSRNWRPFRLVYKETFSSALLARQREYELKRWKSHRAITTLIAEGSSVG